MIDKVVHVTSEVQLLLLGSYENSKTKITPYSIFSSLLCHLWMCVHDGIMTQACGTGADRDPA